MRAIERGHPQVVTSIETWRRGGQGGRPARAKVPRSRGHREERRREAEGGKSQRALAGQGGWHFSKRKAPRQQQHVSTAVTHLVS